MLLPAMRAANVRRLIMACPNKWIAIADGNSLAGAADSPSAWCKLNQGADGQQPRIAKAELAPPGEIPRFIMVTVDKP